MTTKETVIEIQPLIPEVITVTIVGDSDLILNKMNDATVRTLTDQRKDKAKKLEKPNEWEEIVTSIHWLYGKPDIDPEEYTEDTMKEMLEKNRPCISAFGMKKQMKNAAIRVSSEMKGTVFDANVNIVSQGDGLIPINFTQHFIDEKLMSPKRSSQVLVRLNRFSGWSADVRVAFMNHVVSPDGIAAIMNQTGFGLGIGSGTSSGYGRFHVEEVK